MTELEVGTRIANLRKEKDITQMQLAEAIGVSDKTISKWENGGCYPDITLIVKVAEYFGVSVDNILCGVPRKQERIFTCYAHNTVGMEKINNDYLDKGWELVDWKMSSEEESTVILVVLKKESFE